MMVIIPAIIVEIKGDWRGPPPSIDSGYAVVAMIKTARMSWRKRKMRSHGSGFFVQSTFYETQDLWDLRTGTGPPFGTYAMLICQRLNEDLRNAKSKQYFPSLRKTQLLVDNIA